MIALAIAYALFLGMIWSFLIAAGRADDGAETAHPFNSSPSHNTTHDLSKGASGGEGVQFHAQEKY